MACPLCLSNNSRVCEEIQSNRICKLYRSSFGVDIDRLFVGAAVIRFIECGGCGLFYFDPPVTGDGEFYDALQNEPWYYLESKYEYDFVASMIGPGASVLDIGSGKAAFAEQLAPGVKYLGLDFSGAARAKALDRGLQVNNESIESHALVNPRHYDFVVSFQSLEHVHDSHSFLQAAARCARPAGKLVIVVPSEDSFLRFASNSPLNMPPHHVTRWPDRTLREVANLCGLKLNFLHHEPLQDIHDAWAFSVMANAMLGRGKKLIESPESVGARVVSRGSRILAKLLKKFVPREFRPCGHSVIAVYSA